MCIRMIRRVVNILVETFHGDKGNEKINSLKSRYDEDNIYGVTGMAPPSGLSHPKRITVRILRATYQTVFKIYNPSPRFTSLYTRRPAIYLVIPLDARPSAELLHLPRVRPCICLFHFFMRNAQNRYGESSIQVTSMLDNVEPVILYRTKYTSI